MSGVDTSEFKKITGISFFDHIIIGDNRYFSFADEGLIGQYKAVAIREL
jgi:hypothetical protein